MCKRLHSSANHFPPETDRGEQVPPVGFETECKERSVLELRREVPPRIIWPAITMLAIRYLLAYDHHLDKGDAGAGGKWELDSHLPTGHFDNSLG